MMIVAFTTKTSKIIPRIWCGKWKHVAPIVIRGDVMTMYQFIKHGDIQPIKLIVRDLSILGQYGWKFIYLNQNPVAKINTRDEYTCVQFTKRVIGIYDWRIQTPGALYRILTKHNQSE